MEEIYGGDALSIVLENELAVEDTDDEIANATCQRSNLQRARRLRAYLEAEQGENRILRVLIERNGGAPNPEESIEIPDSDEIDEIVDTLFLELGLQEATQIAYFSHDAQEIEDNFVPTGEIVDEQHVQQLSRALEELEATNNNLRRDLAMTVASRGRPVLPHTLERFSDSDSTCGLLQGRDPAVDHGVP